MAVPVTMPELGESVTEGTVTRWLKEVGDTVSVDEPLLEISTDKVDTEIPSPVAGTLLELVVGEDDTVEVGAVLARIGDASESDAPTAAPPDSKPESESAATAQPAAQAEHSPAQERPADPPRTEPPPPPTQDTRHAAPAREAEPRRQPAPAGEGKPTAQAEPAPSRSADSKVEAGRPQPGTTAPMSRLRLTIAKRMTESLTTSAQLTTVQEVDVTRIARLRTSAKTDFERREGVKLTFLPFFAKAVIETLGAFPTINASISQDGKSVTYHREVHLGIAVDTPRGLLAPVIRDAQDLGIAGLARRIADLAECTRAGTITTDELSGGTFTITNIGSVGALFDTPIINQPQVAIMATGAIYRRPGGISGTDGEDQISIRSMCYLPMTYDHRLIDGAEAGRFVGAVRNRLEAGTFESELGQ